MFTLQQIIYFTTAVEKGSLNKAAQELFVSQPGLTKQIARLEKELNCRLLIRKHFGIELTEAGEFFYHKACGILAEISQTVNDIKRYTACSSIRIGALPSLASYYLPQLTDKPHCNEDTKENIEIIVRDTTMELITLLEEGQLEMAFVQDYSGHAVLKTLPLFKEPYDAVLPASHRLSNERSVSFEALTKEKMILHKDPCDIRTSFRQHCYALGVEPNIVLELNFNDSLLPFIEKGYGVSFIPRISTKHIHDSMLTIKEIESHPFYRTISVVFPEQFEENVFQLIAGDSK